MVSKPQYQSTKSLLIKLMKLTIETGLVTTTAAAIELVLAVAFRLTLYHMAIYANCLLATLNARLVLRNPSDKRKLVAVWECTASNPLSSTRQMGTRTMPSTTIEVHTKVETDIELDPYPLGNPFKHSLSGEDA
ncbi:hypothetical protein J3R83DRAFT_2672 [Lanmaoa asiatica]|nr:hypothetical protein J3R83DRAFT_2672 [Lanmaoa asiatica]